MQRERKGQSPFYPGQPVPVELFVGRKGEVARLMRAADQVANGKPQAVFVTGEYGIGKSSLAKFVRVLSEQDPGLLGFHVMLGEADTLEDAAVRTVQTVAESHATRPSVGDSIRDFLAKYIGEQEFFGVRIRLDQLRRDAPEISRGYLPFLRSLYRRACREYRGLLLVLDEINGLAGKDFFARFLKNLVDENALSDKPLPLLLIVCGTEERLRDIITRHRPVERIFEIANIKTMTEEESKEFFTRAFDRVDMSIEPEALRLLTHYSGGLPKLMHLVGDAAFWIAEGDTVTKDVAVNAVLAAAEDVGRKFVEQQVYRAIRSEAYRNILRKLARHDFDLSFKKSEIEKGLTQDERRKLDNFLQRMKRLGVLVSGEERGEYVFRDRLTRLYMRMEAMSEARRLT
ncbi:MAG: hypothetical protein DRP22_04615 [Verrucomicrobia bacterium]|nr:MAG: hypothetical protein DRP22_04615 [Verrucomicrobiota bacterium]